MLGVLLEMKNQTITRHRRPAKVLPLEDLRNRIRCQTYVFFWVKFTRLREAYGWIVRYFVVFALVIEFGAKIPLGRWLSHDVLDPILQVMALGIPPWVTTIGSGAVLAAAVFLAWHHHYLDLALTKRQVLISTLQEVMVDTLEARDELAAKRLLQNFYEKVLVKHKKSELALIVHQLHEDGCFRPWWYAGELAGNVYFEKLSLAMDGSFVGLAVESDGSTLVCLPHTKYEYGVTAQAVGDGWEVNASELKLAAKRERPFQALLCAPLNVDGGTGQEGLWGALTICYARNQFFARLDFDTLIVLSRLLSTFSLSPKTNAAGA